MPEPLSHARRDDAHLAALLLAVQHARSAFDADRCVTPGPAHREETTRLAGVLARAMQDYADAAAWYGVPLPYRYRDQLRLYRSLAPDAGAHEQRQDR